MAGIILNTIIDYEYQLQINFYPNHTIYVGMENKKFFNMILEITGTKIGISSRLESHVYQACQTRQQFKCHFATNEIKRKKTKLKKHI